MDANESGTTGQTAGTVTTLIIVAALIPFMLWSPWALSVVLILACSIYVAFEFALVKVPLREIERDVERGVGGSTVVLRMKRELNAMLAACQFGITLTSLGLTLALEPAIHHALEHSSADLAPAAPALAMSIGAFFHVTFGELVPKGLALVVPRRVLYATAPFMRMFRFLAVPFIKTCNSIASVVVKGLTGKHPDKDTHEGEGIEIDEALKVAQAEGRIAPGQLALMRNVLTFADRTAREVMTPASEVVLLDLSKSWDENMRLAEEHGYSRFPVMRRAHDIVGYVRRAELLKAELMGKRSMLPLIRPIERRPETTKISLLDLFKGAPIIAIYDEHGSFSGLLTAEDVIEQIVGEVYDETDEIEPPSTFEPGPDGSIEIDGGELLDVVADKLGQLGLMEDNEDVDTIGGLILKKLGREPLTGDTVSLGRYDATVTDAQGFRIRHLVLRPHASTGESQVAPLPPSEDDEARMETPA